MILRSSRIGAAIVGILAAASAVAAAEENRSGAGPPGSSAGIFGGFVELRALPYFREGDPQTGLWLHSHLSWEKRISGRLIVKARWNLDADARGEVDWSRLYDGDDRDLHRRPLRIEEMALTWTGRRFDLAAGRMIIPWGRADGFNPTDNLTPYDTLDPLDGERISSWAARAHLYAGRATFETVLLPWPGVTRLPLLGGRWLPVPGRAANPLYPGAGPPAVPLDWRDGRAAYPERALGNAGWAARADYRGSSWEGSVSYYDGWDDQPALVARPGVPRGPRFVVPVALDRVQPDLRATGADLAWVRGRFVLRAEAALQDRGSPNESRFSFTVLEGEWTAGDWRFIAAWASVQGAEGATTTVSSFEQGALPAVIVHVERNVPTGLTASIQVISNLNGEGVLSRAQISWPLRADLRAWAGADLISGPAGSFLGAYEDDDRLVAALRWSF